MLQRIISFVTRHHKRVIAVWLVAAVGLAMVGSTQSYRATTDDMGEFLPDGSESALATRYAREAFGQEKGTRTVTALVERSDGRALDARDRAAVGALSERLAAWRPDVAALDVPGAVGDLGERAGGIVAVSAGPVNAGPFVTFTSRTPVRTHSARRRATWRSDSASGGTGP